MTFIFICSFADANVIAFVWEALLYFIICFIHFIFIYGISHIPDRWIDQLIIKIFGYRRLKLNYSLKQLRPPLTQWTDTGQKVRGHARINFIPIWQVEHTWISQGICGCCSITECQKTHESHEQPRMNRPIRWLDILWISSRSMSVFRPPKVQTRRCLVPDLLLKALLLTRAFARGRGLWVVKMWLWAKGAGLWATRAECWGLEVRELNFWFPASSEPELFSSVGRREAEVLLTKSIS